MDLTAYPTLAMGDEVLRNGYFVIAVDMVKRNITYLTPIMGQNSLFREGE